MKHKSRGVPEMLHLAPPYPSLSAKRNWFIKFPGVKGLLMGGIGTSRHDLRRKSDYSVLSCHKDTLNFLITIK